MQPGKTLIIAGAVLVGIGLFLHLGGRIPNFGQLPGDIVYRKGNVTFYFPITTCLLISALLSLFWFFRR